MKDLFGNETKVHDNIKQKKQAVKTKVESTRVNTDVSELGLNAIWKVFGNWVKTERSNKTL